jgi:hypothetical protein
MERVTCRLYAGKDAFGHVVILARIANYAISVTAQRACLPWLKL